MDAHLRKVLKLIDLTEQSKGRNTPIMKPVVESEADEELPADDWTKYRAVVGLLMHVSADRPCAVERIDESSNSSGMGSCKAPGPVFHPNQYMPCLLTREPRTVTTSP